MKSRSNPFRLTAARAAAGRGAAGGRGGFRRVPAAGRRHPQEGGAHHRHLGGPTAAEQVDGVAAGQRAAAEGVPLQAAAVPAPAGGAAEGRQLGECGRGGRAGARAAGGRRSPRSPPPPHRRAETTKAARLEAAFLGFGTKVLFSEVPREQSGFLESARTRPRRPARGLPGRWCCVAHPQPRLLCLRPGFPRWFWCHPGAHPGGAAVGGRARRGL